MILSLLSINAPNKIIISGIVSTILINLKLWIGDKFTCNILALWKKLPVSDIKSNVLYDIFYLVQYVLDIKDKFILPVN